MFEECRRVRNLAVIVDDLCFADALCGARFADRVLVDRFTGRGTSARLCPAIVRSAKTYLFSRSVNRRLPRTGILAGASCDEGSCSSRLIWVGSLGFRAVGGASCGRVSGAMLVVRAFATRHVKPQ